MDILYNCIMFSSLQETFEKDQCHKNEETQLENQGPVV